MNELFIILPVVAIISIAVIIYATRNAQEIKEEEAPKFQPRKITYVIGKDSYETEKPKRKKKKYYNKKKKPAVAQNETVAKRPVGRPRKVTE